MGLGMIGLGWIAMIPFWALVVLGIVALVKWMGSQGGSTGRSPESALEILSRRYARGEITQEDFKRMKEDIPDRR